MHCYSNIWTGCADLYVFTTSDPQQKTTGYIGISLLLRLSAVCAKTGNKNVQDPLWPAIKIRDIALQTTLRVAVGGASVGQLPSAGRAAVAAAVLLASGPDGGPVSEQCALLRPGDPARHPTQHGGRLRLQRRCAGGAAGRQSAGTPPLQPARHSAGPGRPAGDGLHQCHELCGLRRNGRRWSVQLIRPEGTGLRRQEVVRSTTGADWLVVWDDMSPRPRPLRSSAS